jgi:hypothetical protein
MAIATYSTDLTDYDQADAVANYSALGGGASGLADETDYFIETPQCISKAGFTATTKGFMLDDGGSRTVAAGDAIFVWCKQNNRNLMDTVANGGMQLIVGNTTTAYDHFYVDGNNSDGSDLAGWRSYAVDPTQTPSTTTGGGAAGTNLVGFLWKILGSGSLKGNPNAMDVQRHGRELQVINGEAGSYGTFLAAGTSDAANTNRWGILTPVQGGYLFHGAFVMGTVATAVDFRDSDRVINVLDDPFLPAGFNEFEIRNASSNVEWTNIIINHLGTNSPALLTLNVGTFVGSLCQFTGFSTTTFSSSQSCTDSTWTNCGRINLNEADISGSSILTSTVAADEGAIFDDRTTTASTNITQLANTTISQGANAHHAIRFGANVDDDITLTGIAFNGFSGTDDVNGSTLRFDATTGSITVNFNDCTADGSAASGTNIGIDAPAGLTVTLVFDTVPLKVTVVDSITKAALPDARVYLHKSGDTGTVYFNAECDVNGEVTDSITFPGDTDVVGWAREMNVSGTDYTPKNISGTITSAGLDILVELDPLT